MLRELCGFELVKSTEEEETMRGPRLSVVSVLMSFPSMLGMAAGAAAQSAPGDMLR